MDSKNRIYILLKNYKDKLDIIRGNSIEKILLTLKFNSEYDKLFFNEAKKINLDITNIKEKCINDILENYYNTSKIVCNKNYLEKFKEMPNEELNLIIRDYFRIKEMNLDTTIFRTVNQCLDEELEFYIFEKKCQNGDFVKNIMKDLNSKRVIFPFLEDLFKIELKEEKILIKLLLTARFYQVVNYYLTYDFNSALYESYYEIDNINYNIYNILDNIKSVSQVIKIFDLYGEFIIKANYFYINLSKKEKEDIINSIVYDGKESNLFHIFPHIIFEYNSYYNLKFKSDELESVNVGRTVLSIIEDLTKQAYDGNLSFNEIYSNCVELIIDNYKDMNVEKTFKFIASNVYENICVKNKINEEEKKYINLIESTIEYDEILESEDLLSWVIYKFYEFNGEFFSENELKNLNNKLEEKNKIFLKRLNPYYNEEEKYLK